MFVNLAPGGGGRSSRPASLGNKRSYCEKKKEIERVGEKGSGEGGREGRVGKEGGQREEQMVEGEKEGRERGRKVEEEKEREIKRRRRGRGEPGI